MRKLPLNHLTDTFAYCEASSIYLVYKGERIRLDCGIHDTYEIYHDKQNIYVYIENRRFPYAGLTVYNKKSLDCEFEIFYDSQDDTLKKLINGARIPSKIRLLLEWWI